MCASHLIVTIVLDIRNDLDASLSEENREWNVEFWIFNICLFIANFPMTIANTGFIFAAVTRGVVVFPGGLSLP